MKPLNLQKFLFSLMLLIMIMVALIGLVSCNKYTPQIADQQVTKAYLKYTPMVAKKTRAWFPCINTKDTVTKIDSTAYAIWKASTDSTIKSYEDFLNALTPEVIIDSANCIEKEAALQRNANVYKKQLEAKNEQIKLLNIAISNTKPIIQTITLPPVEDSAKIYELSDGLMKAVNETAKEKEAKENAIERGDKWRKWCIIFLIAFLASALVNYIQLRKR